MSSKEKNRKKSKRKFVDREFIRVATASKLMAAHFYKTGKNLKGSSVIGCGRWRAKWLVQDKDVAEIHVDEYGARMHGHFKCNSVWTCDHCARIQCAKARSWIRAGLIPSYEKRGYMSSMITLTAAHSYDGDWGLSISRLHDAYKLFDKRLSHEYKAIGSIGKLKALEAPIGANGIHGHFHILVVHRPNMDMIKFENKARSAWKSALNDIGGRCNNHGFDLLINGAPDYVAKMEMAHEMTSPETKTITKAGSTLGQLLDKARKGDEKASAEWYRAIEALQGRSRFHSGKLGEKLGIPPCSEWTDEEIKPASKDDIEVPVKPLKINYPLSQHLKATAPEHPSSGLAVILRVAKRGSVSKVRRIVELLCERYDEYILSKEAEVHYSPEQLLEMKMFAEAGGDINFD